MKYKRLALITDESGQGELYRGVDEHGESVAIKYLKVSSAAHEAERDRKRFVREVKCQRDLVHPNIVPVLASKLKSDRPYYVMPLADGSLRELLAFHPTGMPEDAALELILKVASAVAFAHRHNVIHRDLKPENVLMFGETPRVSDFGLGRRLSNGSTTITMTHVGLGTLNYAAPEQLEDGHSADGRCDIYSLGRMLYEMLCGRRPFMQLDLSLVPARFRHVIHKATATRPDDRFATIGELRSELKSLAEGLDHIRSPLSRARGLLTAIADRTSGPNDLSALESILISNSEDVPLYEAFVQAADEDLLVEMFDHSRSTFRALIQNLDRFAQNQRFDFDFTDHLADCLARIYWIDEDVNSRMSILNRLLGVAYNYNRYYVRDKFVELATTAMRDDTYVSVIAQILRDLPEAKPLVEKKLLQHSLPPMIVRELAA